MSYKNSVNGRRVGRKEPVMAEARIGEAGEDFSFIGQDCCLRPVYALSVLSGIKETLLNRPMKSLIGDGSIPQDDAVNPSRQPPSR